MAFLHAPSSVKKLVPILGPDSNHPLKANPDQILYGVSTGHTKIQQKIWET